jgi:hypothetical protein
MSSEHNQPVFTYHTRVSVTPEQDQMLRGYTSLFGRVERTLYADMQKGKDASELKSAYLPASRSRPARVHWRESLR